MISLTDEQKGTLFAFAKSKGVEDLDLQDEVVKELAGKIYIEMMNHPLLNFEQALENVYSRFPITGFAVFLNEKQKEIRKYCRKKYFASLWRFWAGYRIMLLTLIFGFCFAMSFLLAEWPLLIFLILTISLYYYVFRMGTKKFIAPDSELKKQYFIRTYVMYFTDGFENDRNFSIFHRILFLGWIISIPFHIEQTNVVLFKIVYGLTSSLLLGMTFHSYFEMPKLINEEIRNRFSHLIPLTEDKVD